MTTVAKAKERLDGCGGEQHVAVAIWGEEDVLERARKRGMTITQEQAREIIDTIDHKQDCELGISWDTIDCYLDEL